MPEQFFKVVKEPHGRRMTSTRLGCRVRDRCHRATALTMSSFQPGRAVLQRATRTAASIGRVPGTHFNRERVPAASRRPCGKVKETRDKFPSPRWQRSGAGGGCYESGRCCAVAEVQWFTRGLDGGLVHYEAAWDGHGVRCVPALWSPKHHLFSRLTFSPLLAKLQLSLKGNVKLTKDDRFGPPSSTGSSRPTIVLGGEAGRVRSSRELHLEEVWKTGFWTTLRTGGPAREAALVADNQLLQNFPRIEGRLGQRRADPPNLDGGQTFFGTACSV